MNKEIELMMLKTKKNINEISNVFKQIEQITGIVNSEIIEEVSLLDIEQEVLNADYLHEIVPLDIIKTSYIANNNHRDLMAEKKLKVECVYTCKLGAILKSEKNVQRYYLIGDIIPLEICCIKKEKRVGKTILIFTSKNYIIKENNFYNFVLSFFEILKTKSQKV